MPCLAQDMSQRLTSAPGRNAVVCRQRAVGRQEEVIASGDSGEAGVCCCRDVRNIEVQRHMGQLGSLKAAHRGGVARAHRVVGHVAKVGVCPAPDPKLGTGAHFDAEGASPCIPAEDRARHSIDEVNVLADIVGDVDLHPDIDRHLERLQRLVGFALASDVIVWIALHVRIDPGLWRVIGEERPTPGHGEDGRLWVRLEELA